MGALDDDETGATPPLPPPPPREAQSEPEMTAEQKLYWMNALQVEGDWSVHDDGDGRLFYYHRRSNASQWEAPDELSGLEGDFMMKLMLQNAVARSGAWSAHDAGNGTLYYFHAKTRESVWERPEEWGLEERAPAPGPPVPPARPEAEVIGSSAVVDTVASGDVEVADCQPSEDEKPEKVKKIKKEKKHKKKHHKHKEAVSEPTENIETEVKAENRVAAAEELHNAEHEADEVEEEQEEPPTEEELQAMKEQEAREAKRVEQFRALLRSKNIMPFTKWSVALPQLAGDPRFMGVQTMDERRAIFEHFVAHRREDLKAEKKLKLKQAKHLFLTLLREQFQLPFWDTNTTLSVFLSTLEDHMDADRYQQLQDDSLAYLPMSVQEKIYANAVAKFQAEADKRVDEEKRLSVFLTERLVSSGENSLGSWESDGVQQLMKEFYSTTMALLSTKKQQQVFEALASQAIRGRSAPQDNGGPAGHGQEHRSPVRERRDPSPRRESRDSTRGHDRDREWDRGRGRSRSHSRRRSRSRSDEHIGRNKRAHSHRSSNRRSSRRRSSSRSSRSPSHSHSRSRRHRRRSSSASRSRSRTR